MHTIIWRNRASAILGLLIMILPFTGFPGLVKDSLFVVLGAMISLFGFTSTRHRTITSDASSSNQ